MEKSIQDWLDFSQRVELGLAKLKSGFSSEYRGSLIDMINDIKVEAEQFDQLSLTERQESFIRLNRLGSDLKNVAHFVAHRS